MPYPYSTYYPAAAQPVAGYSNYNPYMYASPVPVSGAQMPAQNEFKYYPVHGEEGVNSFYVAPGQSVLLMDSENQSFYVKSVDQNGMPLPLRVFDFTERVPVQSNSAGPDIDLSSYATREDLAEIRDMIKELKASMTTEKGASNARKSAV